MVKPGGTGRPMRVISARFAPLPPRMGFMLASPSGTYTCTKSVLGETVKAVVKIDSATSFDFSVTGPVSISCTGEAYKYDDASGAISLPNINDPNDCLNKTLTQQSVKLTSFSYDKAGDSIHIVVKYSIFSIDLLLTHGGVVVRHRREE